MTDQSQTVRCPCCGETFILTPDVFVQPESAAVAPVESATAPIPIRLVFDGGSRGNGAPGGGQGYGSYQLTVRGRAEAPVRLEFGENYTNNEAEYDTLIAALEAISRRAQDPKRVQLDIRGDSKLVIKQITGEWKIKEPRMLQRVQRVRALLQQFGSWKAQWHARSNSVEALGH